MAYIEGTRYSSEENVFSFSFNTGKLRSLWMPVCTTIVVFLNCIIVYVYAMEIPKVTRAKRSSNFLLISCSVSNTLTVLIPMPWYVFAYTFGQMDHGVPAGWCFEWNLFELFIPKATHTVSIWISILLAVQRTTALKFPIKANLWWSMGKVLFIIFVMVLISFGFHAMEFTMNTYHYSNVTIGIENQTLTVCTIVFKDMSAVYHIIWTTGHSLICHFIPISILIGSDVIIVRLLKQSVKLHNNKYGNRHLTEKPGTMVRQDKLVCNCKQVSVVGCTCALGYQRRMRDHRRMTILITVFTITIALVELPLGILVMVISLLKYYRFEDLLYLTGPASAFVHVLIFICYPLLFVYSCFLNQQFQDSFKRLCMRLRPVGQRLRHHRTRSAQRAVVILSAMESETSIGHKT